MNNKENQQIEKIAKHVAVLNHELGKVQIDIRWIKRIIYYMAGIGSVAVGKVLIQ